MKILDVVVKKDFPTPDRYTGIKYKAGTRLKITDARFREIQRSGDYVEVVKAAETAKPAEAKKESK